MKFDMEEVLALVHKYKGVGDELKGSPPVDAHEVVELMTAAYALGMQHGVEAMTTKAKAILKGPVC